MQGFQMLWAETPYCSNLKGPVLKSHYKSIELGRMQQPRKCRKCEEMRDASEFPVDPLHTSKRMRDCQYCIQDAGGHPGMAAPMASGAPPAR